MQVQMNQMNDQKYKTSLCKHWSQNGQCTRGEQCHFAHGQQELRAMNSQVQPHQRPQKPLNMNTNINTNMYNNGNYQNKVQNQGQQNFKSVQCKYFKDGFCRYGNSCTYAHGVEEQKPTQFPVYNNQMQQQQQYQQNLLSYNNMINQQQQQSMMMMQQMQSQQINMNVQYAKNMQNYAKYLSELIKELEQLNVSHISDMLNQAKSFLNQGQFAKSQEILSSVQSNENTSEEEKEQMRNVIDQVYKKNQEMFSQLQLGQQQ